MRGVVVWAWACWDRRSSLCCVAGGVSRLVYAPPYYNTVSSGRTCGRIWDYYVMIFLFGCVSVFLSILYGSSAMSINFAVLRFEDPHS